MQRESNKSNLSPMERIRWVSLGLGSADEIDDIPLEQSRKIQIQLRNRLRQQSRLGADPNLGPSPIYRYATTAVVAMTLITLAIWTVNSAIANQRINTSDKYATGVMGLALDLYEEDLEVLVEKSVVADQLLPTPGFMTTDNNNMRFMNACTEAIHGLKMVRMGYPSLGMQKLSFAHEVLTSNQSSSNCEDLDLVFYIVAGKATIEAFDTLGSRNATRDPNWDIAFQQPEISAENALNRSLKILDLGLSGFSIEDETLLRAAIGIDLGRHKLKTTTVRIETDGVLEVEERLSQVQKAFDESKFHLDSLIRKDARWLVQESRLLNNQILLESRFSRIHADSLDEFLTKLDDFEITITGLLEFGQSTLDPSNPHVNAVAFELAVCNSNLGDLVHQYLDRNQAGREDLRLREDKFRRAAVIGLQSIPEIKRTERHKENLILNEAQLLLSQLKSSTLNGKTDEVTTLMVADAKIIQWYLGDVLKSEIGQVSLAARVAIALILSEQYPLEKVSNFFESKKEFFSPQDIEFFQKLIANRTANEN